MQTAHYCLEDGRVCTFCNEEIIPCEDRIVRIQAGKFAHEYRHETCELADRLGITPEELTYGDTDYLRLRNNLNHDQDIRRGTPKEA